jgi:hypothetical protein
MRVGAAAASGYPPGMGMDTGAERSGGSGDVAMGYDNEGIMSEEGEDTIILLLLRRGDLDLTHLSP